MSDPRTAVDRLVYLALAEGTEPAGAIGFLIVLAKLIQTTPSLRLARQAWVLRGKSAAPQFQGMRVRGTNLGLLARAIADIYNDAARGEVDPRDLVLAAERIRSAMNVCPADCLRAVLEGADLLLGPMEGPGT